jgi:hypothetical protein
MITEVALFLLAIFVIVVAFGAALSCLKQDNPEFHGLHKSISALVQMVLRMYSPEKYNKAAENLFTMTCIIVVLLMCLIFLLNLLTAQLSCAYQAIYEDMVGYARLNRMRMIVETIATVKSSRWKAFVQTLKLQTRIEFNEGDIGLSGGIATTEASSLNPLTIDMIRRYGGNTNPANPWPEQDEDATDRFERLEKLCAQAVQRATMGDGGGSSQGQVEDDVEVSGIAASEGSNVEHDGGDMSV